MTTRTRRRKTPTGGGAEQGLDLGNLFNAALQNVNTNRQAINDLDGANGNHGDNMVHNLQVVTEALQTHKGQTPSDQLSYAANQLQANAKGGTGQYYANGLSDAAQKFQGRASINQNDIGSLLQSVMGNVPVKPSGQVQPRPQASQGGGDLGSLLGGLMGGGQAPQQATPQASAGSDPMAALLGGLMGGGQPAPQQSMPQSGGDPMAALLGGLMGGGAPQQPQAPADPMTALLGSLMSGGTPQPQSGANVLTALMGMSQQPQPKPGNNGLDLGDLLTAGMAFMQAKQQGADNMQAGMQAVMAALMGGQVNPLAAGSPQAAAGGLIAQSLLQAAMGGRK
ncbi:MAG: DAK2 domain-containing protein [Anaerolineales bacterium]|nr:DAK2 domain-containing protein [Anaerolineales bacterium]